ncbi:MAG: hypothetical protein WAP03_25830, partial [Methylorubrum rhodinum]
MPLHPHLVEMGFLEFADGQRHEALFYDARATRKATAATPPYKKLGERLAAWVRSIGVDDVGVDPNHGWRHRFKMVGRRAGIASDVLNVKQRGMLTPDRRATLALPHFWCMGGDGSRLLPSEILPCPAAF